MDNPILGTLSALAAAQHGCVSRTQLRGAGISPRRADSLRERGALRRVMAGVDLVCGAVFTPAAAAQSALLRGGAAAELGGRTALEWRSILEPDHGRIVVWVPRSSLGQRREVTTGLAVTATGRPAVVELVPSRITGRAELVEGFAAATVPDAIAALAATAGVRAGADARLRHAAAVARRDCTRAWKEADFRGLLTRERMREAVIRRRGGARLVAELGRTSPLVGENATLLSRAERRLLAGLVRRGIEPPFVNAALEIGGRTEYPDFLYPVGLAVEVDGAGHDRAGRQAKDLAREERLRAHGIETVRFADQEVWRDLEGCLDEVERRLARRP